MLVSVRVMVAGSAAFPSSDGGGGSVALGVAAPATAVGSSPRVPRHTLSMSRSISASVASAIVSRVCCFCNDEE